MASEGSKGIRIENDVRFQSFLIFEPASARVHDMDILARGPKVKELFDDVMYRLSSGDSLQDLIIQNRLSKIGKMMDLITNFDNVVLTKFFDRIWRRYSHLSNLGETFLDFKTFSKVFPDYTDQRQTLLAQRLDEEEEIVETSFHVA